MKFKKVFTKKLAIYLRNNGFEIVGTEVNYKFPQYDVYMFEDTPKLASYILKYGNK